VTAPESRTPQGRQRVTPADFFSAEHEKTKFNWFLFEYACALESAVRSDRRLCSRLRRRGVDEQALTAFFVHHSKNLRTQMLDRLAGKTESMRFGYETIEAYFPHIGDELVDRLLTKAAEAWDAHTSACVVCPTRCISEKDQRASMFDDAWYWE
jgi:hypothetical protein